MIDRQTLLTDLQKLLKKLEDDLLRRSESSEVPDVGAALHKEFEQAKAADRTAQNFEDWRSDAITQAAAAWVLTCVFVRFLEDNRLIDPPKIAGPGDRLQRSHDEWELYLSAAKQPNERDYLLAVFDDLAKLPGTRDVFGGHNPLRQLPNWLSGDAARELLNFFRKIDTETGLLVHDFTDPNWSTRFLGDLYQDLSEAARKKYALLQTPEFVEEFILDRTLEPALDEFGLDAPPVLGIDNQPLTKPGFRMIDPACGSGHFLLGAFRRLFERRQKKDPGAKPRASVQHALDSVYGVDVNPYAVAIARFRLLLAAMQACGAKRLADAPAFEIHVACGDSLLHGPGSAVQGTLGDMVEVHHAYQPEDLPLLRKYLTPGIYHAVVANPPYIVPRDAALNQAYRERYKSCHRQYSLAVPFLERIFKLAVSPTRADATKPDVRSGYTGQITANSFMKREFGKRLIEEFITQIDLTHVVDSSGAFIPGHGTPTVFLFGRNRSPVAQVIRTVMGISGEPSTPEDASKGVIWTAIQSQIDHPGSESDYISVADVPRSRFEIHPWSITGGGASELKLRIAECSKSTLESLISEIGRTTHVGEDDAYFLPLSAAKTLGFASFTVPVVSGEEVRDYTIDAELVSIFPYDKSSGEPISTFPPGLNKHFWRLRRVLKARVDFGQTVEERGLRWLDHTMFFPDRFTVELSIACPNISSHLHFSLGHSRRLYNSTVPAVTLPRSAGEDEHFVLLAYLNSSVACFWMKQISHQKQMTGGDGVRVESRAKVPYQYSATQLKTIPLPSFEAASTAHLVTRLTELGRLANRAAETMSKNGAHIVVRDAIRSNRSPTLAWNSALSVLRSQRSQLIGIQEEIDFTVYALFGFCDESLLSSRVDWSELGLEAGMRPFNLICGKNDDGFDVPASLPSDWPKDVKDRWNARTRLISQSLELRVIEDSHYKRRWVGRQGLFNATKRGDELREACRNALLDRLESYVDFDGRMNDDAKPTAKFDVGLVSVARLADTARQDADFMQVGELYRDDPTFDVAKLVAELVEAESVPLLPVLRYKESGLRKRIEWEKTWALQRREDAGEKVGEIDVPPKYASADFLKSDFSRLRGKLDVPKERWVSFPHCEGSDGTLMIAWAGYDHLQLAQAVSAHYVDVKERLGGTDDPRLTPLLACLVELLPWIKQWHNEPSKEFDGMRMGDYFDGFVTEELRSVNKTINEIKAWTPPKKAIKKGRKASAP